MKHIFFFDLDGTLTDSAEGITSCVVYALEKQNLPIPSYDILRSFIGPPLIDSFVGLCGMTEQQAVQAVHDYRERFSTIGLFENHVYEGILPLLSTLKAAGKHCYVVTSKPEEYSVRICDRFGITPYVEHICGATLDGSINSKEAVIRLALEVAGQPAPFEVEMIGDRLHDIEGARACGIECTYVLYGFGSREEAETHRAAHIVETVAELQEHLLHI